MHKAGAARFPHCCKPEETGVPRYGGVQPGVVGRKSRIFTAKAERQAERQEEKMFFSLDDTVNTKANHRVGGLSNLPPSLSFCLAFVFFAVKKSAPRRLTKSP